jgi:hypothetical protein
MWPMGQPVRAADPPWCGGRNLDLSAGFHANLYMFGGSPQFSLTYDVPASGTLTGDALLGATPVRITFVGVDAPPSEPWVLNIGYENLDLRERDGRRLMPDYFRLECGDGAELTLASNHIASPNLPPGRSDFMSVFTGGYRPDRLRPETDACFEEMQRTGRFRFSLSRRRGDAPVLVLEGTWGLRAAVHAVRALWRRDIERARIGQCRIMPPPPPPD